MMREDLITEARKYIDVKYSPCGVSDNALDCIGVLALAAENIGIAPKEMMDNIRDNTIPFARTPVLYKQLHKYLKRIDKKDLKPADIMLFREPNGTFATHVALYTGDGKILHSNMKVKKVIEVHISDYWWNNLAGIFAFKCFVEDEM